MTLQGSSKVRGWTALVLIGLGVLIVLATPGAGLGSDVRTLAAVLFWVGVIFFWGWRRQRRRIRVLDYQAAAFKKG